MHVSDETTEEPWGGRKSHRYKCEGTCFKEDIALEDMLSWPINNEDICSNETEVCERNYMSIFIAPDVDKKTEIVSATFDPMLIILITASASICATMLVCGVVISAVRYCT